MNACEQDMIFLFMGMVAVVTFIRCFPRLKKHRTRTNLESSIHEYYTGETRNFIYWNGKYAAYDSASNRIVFSTIHYATMFNVQWIRAPDEMLKVDLLRISLGQDDSRIVLERNGAIITDTIDDGFCWFYFPMLPVSSTEFAPQSVVARKEFTSRDTFSLRREMYGSTVINGDFYTPATNLHLSSTILFVPCTTVRFTDN